MKRIRRVDALLRQRIGERRRKQEIERRRERRSVTAHGPRRLAPPEGASYDSKNNRLILPVPQKLDLRDNRQSTLAFLDALRKLVFFDHARVLLNFEDTDAISPAAMLLLVSEIFRCRQARPATKLTGTYPRAEKVHRHMQACGFFRLLNVKHILPESSKTYPLEYIPFMSGTESVGQDADELRSALLGPTLRWTKEAGDAIYRGLTEAMTNVVNHAYPDEALTEPIKRLRNRWWMVGHFNRLRKELCILFFDQGVGIPKTLPKRFGMEQIRAVLGALSIITPNDAELIGAAMAIGRTKTGQEHRGKGLNDFKKLLDACRGGRLSILSNRGVYQYAYPSEERTWNHLDSVRGTLIEWTVPIDAIANFTLGDSDGNAASTEHRA